MLKDDGSNWCTLPDLPDDRFGHSQYGLVTCGGGTYNTDSWTSCLTLSSGAWNQTQNLKSQGRSYHLTWSSPSGLLLMGGGDSSKDSSSESFKTTEIITDIREAFKKKNKKCGFFPHWGGGVNPKSTLF